MSKQEKWSQYWEHESAQGEVFVDSDGKKHPQLAEFWRKTFATFERDANIIDLACGAGSIFHAIDYDSFQNLTASDLSEVALEKLSAEMPKIDVVCSSCSKLPNEANSFDVIVSQFGIEYAGEEGFVEAARVLKKSGKLVCLIHYKDGYIDTRNKEELAGVDVITGIRFIDVAKDVATAFAENEQAKIEAAVARFMALEPLAHQAIKKFPNGMHVHAYNGTKQLLQDFSNYKLNDVITWLDKMRVELDRSKERLADMRSVAFDETRIERLKERLAQTGLISLNATPFTLTGHNLPVCWELSASK